jgi:hypothetical protein
MPKRAKGMLRGSTKGKARTNDNSRLPNRVQSPRVLSSEDSRNVGRPGFGGFLQGPVDGKLSVRRLMRRDPAKGITQPQADKITTTNVDIVGPVSPTVKSTVSRPDSFGAGRRAIKRAGNRLKKR